MIVLLYGPDSYRRAERKNFFIAEFYKKYGLTAEIINLAEDSGKSSFRTAASQTSLFSPKKLLVIEEPYELEPKELKQLTSPFLESKELHLLVIADKKPVKALGFLLEAPAKPEEFSYLEGAAWAAFVKKEIKKRNIVLSAPALDLVLRAYEGNTWGLMTELNKLASVLRPLEAEDLFSLGLDVAADSFPLIQGLKSPFSAGRLKALATLFYLHEPGAKIFNILAALWPQKINSFSEYDKAIKFGRMDYDEALTDMAIN